jgi:hypothetical protein
MADENLTADGLARLHGAAAAHDLIVIVLTQRMFESPALPRVHQDVRAAAYAALG